MQKQKLVEKTELKEPKATSELQGKGIKIELQDIPREFKVWFIKTFKENAKRIDVLHEYDRKLSVGENISQFKDRFEILVADDEKLKEQVANARSQIDKSKSETEKRLREQERVIIDKWKKSDFQKIAIRS